MNLRISSLLTLAVLSLPATAVAQEPSDGYVSAPAKRGLGVGVETVLGVPAGPLAGAGVMYDAGDFRIHTLLFLTFDESDDTDFGITGRFFYVVHRAKAADFSLGGGVGLIHAERAVASSTRIYLEGIGQLRFFPVSNVAVMASLGLGVGFGDGGFAFGLGGQLFGSFGAAYFF